MVKLAYRGVAQMARVLRLGRRGREFESHHPDIWNFGYKKAGHLALLLCYLETTVTET
jgi:hypothetical protein